MTANINATGTYAVKFRIFGITLWVKRGTINFDYNVSYNTNFHRTVDLPGPIDLGISVIDDQLNLGAMLGAQDLYVESFDIPKLLEAPGIMYVKIDNFRGITVDGKIVIKLSK